MKRLKLWLQHVLPGQFLSNLVNRATRWRWRPWRRFLISRIVGIYKVDMDEAQVAELDSYEHFNAFFTRQLKPEVRPRDAHPQSLLCPVDGAVSQAGAIDGDQIFQAKGHHYSTEALLGDARLARRYENGQFATLYLSPRDYHRIHMPCDGTLTDTVHVPGRLFSVAPFTVEGIPGLFARNERLVCQFQGQQGPFVMVLVGAILVSSIQTVWGGVHTPPYARSVQHRHFDDPNSAPSLKAGEEMGRFNMGSTVIILFPADGPGLDPLVPGQTVRWGQRIGQLLTR